MWIWVIHTQKASRFWGKRRWKCLTHNVGNWLIKLLLLFHGESWWVLWKSFAKAKHRSFAMVPAGCYGLASFHLVSIWVGACPGIKHRVDLHGVSCTMYTAAETFPVSQLKNSEIDINLHIPPQTDGAFGWLSLHSSKVALSCRSPSFCNDLCLQGFLGLFCFPIHIARWQGLNEHKRAYQYISCARRGDNS